MSRNTSALGRLKLQNPEFLYDTYDGGTELYNAVTAMFKKIADNITTRWSGDLTLAAGVTQTLQHDFGMSLSQIKVLVFEAGTLLSKAQTASKYIIAQVDTNAISIQNKTGASLTCQVVVIGYSLGIRDEDFDPAVDLDTTGNVSATKVSTKGDDIDINADATGSGTDRKATIRRGASMSEDAVIELPSSSGKLIADTSMPWATAAPAAVTTGNAAPGTAVKAAREDHIHKLPAHTHVDAANGGPMGISALAAVSGKTYSMIMRDINGSPVESFDAVTAALMPRGTTAQRPANIAGLMRYNTDLQQFEGNNGSAWGAIGGGSSGINYIIPKDFESYNAGATTGDWTASGATTVITNIAGEVLFGTKSLKLTSATNGGYVRLNAVYVDYALVGQGVSFSLRTLGLGGYTPTVGAQEWQFVVRKVTGSNQGPLEYTRKTIPGGSYKITGTFVPDEVAQYVFELYKVGTTSQVISIDLAEQGPVVPLTGSNSTDWISYNATIYNAGTQSVSAKYRMNNGELEISISANISSAGSGIYSVSLPPGFNYDINRMSVIGSDANIGAGNGYASINNGAIRYELIPDFSTGGTDRIFLLKYNGTVIGSSDFNTVMLLFCVVKMPVIGYGSNVMLADRATERYYYNDSAWDSDDATGASSKDGPLGTPIGGATSAALTAANRVKTILVPGLQPTDKVFIEVKDDNNDGFTSCLQGMDNFSWAYNSEDVDSRGIGIQSVNYSTGQIRVVIGKYARKFGGAAQAWPLSSTGYKWRILVVSQGAMTGIGPMESRYLKGITDGSAALAGFVGEIKESFVTTATSLAAVSTSRNLTSIALPSGVWDVQANAFAVTFTGSANDGTHRLVAFPHTTSEAYPSSDVLALYRAGVFARAGTADCGGSSGLVRITVPPNTNTTVYCVVSVWGTGLTGATFTGGISARRVM